MTRREMTECRFRRRSAVSGGAAAAVVVLLLRPAVIFQNLWRGWNRRTMWSRVLRGRLISRSLSFICFRCAMKIPIQSRQL
ncbi:hypothetical protein Hanom_Chr06g00547091 [Helianthus anomalus]